MLKNKRKILHPSSAAVREMVITVLLKGIRQNYNEELETSTEEGPALAEGWREPMCPSRFPHRPLFASPALCPPSVLPPTSPQFNS